MTFIEAYLKKKEYDKKVGYALWLEEHGNADRDYQKAVGEAEELYHRNLSTYGVTGEQLARNGLGVGGYGDYLTMAAKEAGDAAKEAAYRTYLTDKREEKEDYSAYLKQVSDRTTQAIKALLGLGVQDATTAKQYALGLGLGERDADLVSTLVGEMGDKKIPSDAEKSIRLRILNQAVELMLPVDATYAYALSCGMTEEDAAEISQAVKAVLDGKYGYRDVYYKDDLQK